MSVNKEMFMKVADAIEKEQIDGFPVRYNQAIWGWEHPINRVWSTERTHSCGTSACVAGFASLISKGHINSRVVEDGREALGISEIEADGLFYSIGIVNANKRLVPDALRYMGESGDVSWVRGFKYARCVRRTNEGKETEVES